MSATPAPGSALQALRGHPSYKWAVLATVGLGILTSTVDGSIINIALPVLAEEFGTDAGTVLWVTVAYLLASTSLMLTLGRLGDLIGRKRLLLIGYLVFTAGLALASLSQDLAQLLGARLIQGTGQAMIISNGNALIVDAFPASERGRALGTSGAIVGLGLTSGPPLGGLLLELLGWRSLFYTRIPFGLVFLILAALVLRPDAQSVRAFRFDLLGAFTLFTGLASLLLTVNRGPRLGWTEPVILALGVTSLLSLAAFLLAERRAHTPVLELALFRSRLFSAANAANVLHFLSQGAIVILMPFFLLQGRALSPSQAGLVLISIPAVRLLVSPPAGWAADKVPSRVICTAGLLVMIGAYGGLRYVGLDTPIAFLVALLVLEGFGTSVFGPGNNSAIMGAVPPSHLGTASGMIAAVREVSTAMGIALAGTLFTAFQAAHEARLLSTGVAAELATRQAVTLGTQEVLTAMLLFLAVGAIVSALRGPDRTAHAEPIGWGSPRATP